MSYLNGFLNYEAPAQAAAPAAAPLGGGGALNLYQQIAPKEEEWWTPPLYGKLVEGAEPKKYPKRSDQFSKLGFQELTERLYQFAPNVDWNPYINAETNFQGEKYGGMWRDRSSSRTAFNSTLQRALAAGAIDPALARQMAYTPREIADEVQDIQRRQSMNSYGDELNPTTGFAAVLSAGALAGAFAPAATATTAGTTAGTTGALSGSALASEAAALGIGGAYPGAATAFGTGAGVGSAAGAFDAGGFGAAESMGLGTGYSSPSFALGDLPWGVNEQTWAPQPPYNAGSSATSGAGSTDWWSGLGLTPSDVGMSVSPWTTAPGVAALGGNVGSGGGLFGSNMSLQDLARYGSMVQSLSGAVGGVSSLLGANQAAGAARQAAQTQSDMFNVQNAQQAPYRQSGYGALANLNYLTGNMAGPIDPSVAYALGYPGSTGVGQLLRPFTAADLKTNLAPNYEFMRDQGLLAAGNALAPMGGRLSGNTAKELMRFAEGYAGEGYQQAFQNYNTNQTNIYNRLANIAGLGQTANTQSAQLAGSLAPSIGQSQIAAGQAQSAGTIGLANALTQSANNAMSWYALPELMRGLGN